MPSCRKLLNGSDAESLNGRQKMNEELAAKFTEILADYKGVKRSKSWDSVDTVRVLSIDERMLKPGQAWDPERKTVIETCVVVDGHAIPKWRVIEDSSWEKATRDAVYDSLGAGTWPPQTEDKTE